jgi:hypothetical protein
MVTVVEDWEDLEGQCYAFVLSVSASGLTSLSALIAYRGKFPTSS